jgi:hypothetical protein
MFKGTTYEGKFFIMHDGLSQWWEKEAQEYMEMLGFKDRQIKCLPPANEGNRYAGKLVGNRPELMPLDAHLFSDFTFSFWFHCSVTSLLAPEDPRRFNCGTPKELSHSLRRVWEVSPTPARILEDCGAIRQRLERIVAEKGVAIQDIYFRTGRRYISASGGRVLKGKPRKRQRKATNELPEVHPDAREAFESFQGSLSVDADT